MKRTFICLFLLALSQGVRGEPGERPGVLTGTLSAPLLVAANDGGQGRIYLLGTDGKMLWEHRGVGNVHRALLVGGRLFYSNGAVYCVERPESGERRLVYDPTPAAHSKKFPDGEGVYGFDVLANGNLLVAENGTDHLAEVTPEGRAVRRIKASSANAAGETNASIHHHFRMCRATPSGTWLVCCSGAGIVREYQPATGALIGEWSIGELAFDACRTPNGTTLVSHLSAVSEFGPDKRLLRRWSWAERPSLALKNTCGLQLLPNGNIVLGTYRNGPADGHHTTACELTPEGKAVWSFASTNEVTAMGVCLGDMRSK